jgi:hypothetical protein
VLNGAIMNQEDATKLLIQWLRKPNHGDWGSYGYGVYLPALLRTFLSKFGGQLKFRGHPY